MANNGNISLDSTSSGSTLTVGGTLTNAGTILATGNSAATGVVNATVDNQGSITVAGSNLSFVSGDGASGDTVTNEPGASIDVSGGQTLTVGGSLTNQGNISLGTTSDAGTLTVGGTLDNQGTLDHGTTINNGGSLPSTSISVTASPAATDGQPVILTATVTAGSGTFDDGGTVQFLVDGNAVPGSWQVSNGTATTTLPIGYLSPGTHLITAVFSHDSNFAGSSSQAGPGSLITTLAGGSTTELADPSSVAVDAQGDVFLADSGDNVVRELVKGVGPMITVAGNGTAGFAGDNGPATAAELSDPQGIAVETDAGGDLLFIADARNNRVREVNLTSGIITTVAGTGKENSSVSSGAATSVAIYTPTSVALDGSGNLFIADSGDHRVRKVNLAAGTISTVAGGGRGMLSTAGRRPPSPWAIRRPWPWMPAATSSSPTPPAAWCMK